MSAVRIRGLISTTTMLRGEERTVEHTEQVQRLVDNGYVAIVGGDKAVIEEQPVQDPPAPVQPARNASRQEWRDFLTDLGIPFDEGDTRDDLISRWDLDDA